MAGRVYDVVVVGAGNAGLTAALAARQAEAHVLLLDKCPKAARGGNTRFSGGGFRFTYGGLDDMRPMLPGLTDEEAAKMEVGTYSTADFFADIMQVTEYAADKKLTNILVDQSYATARWLTDMNVKWILSTSTHAVKVGQKIKFPSGRVISVNDGGLGLVEMLFPAAESKGIEIVYEARANGLILDKKGKVAGVRVQTSEGTVNFKGRAVVLAAGGFEANPEMRARYLGTGWDLVKVRGSRYNSGEVLNLALGFGAQPVGHWSGCHAVLVDAEAPDVECAYEHRYSYPYGIMVDINGKRFVDEGEDFFSYTYAKCGREVLRLPWRTAYQIFDSKTRPLLRSEYNKGSHVSADSIEALAKKLPGLDWANVVKTVNEFNEAVGDAPFDPSKHDGKCTQGISPVKSNWAQRLDTPPYYAFPVTRPRELANLPEIGAFTRSQMESQVLTMSRVFWGVGTLIYLPPGTPDKLVEILRQAFRSSFEDRQFHEQYKKLLGLPPTPLMPEEQQKLVAELPRDSEVVKVFKTIVGMDPLPLRR